jgi:hypothetical protein
MNKWIIVGVVVLLGGVVVATKLVKRPEPMRVVETASQRTESIQFKNGEVWVDVGKSKLSMVDIKLKASEEMGAFRANKDIFNSELLNKAENDGSWHVVLGVMKSTAELPSGQVLVGKLVDYKTGEVQIDGKLTIPAEGKEMPKEVSVSFGEVMQK